MTGTAVPLLPWQDKLWATVGSARERGALNHAWLLAGPEGVGKRHFAAALAASLLCLSPSTDGQACGDCRSCKMLANGGHPDAHLLSRDGHLGLAAHHSLHAEKGLSFWAPKPTSMRRDIAVDAARSLIEKLSTVAHLGGNRVVVIEPASELSTSAANALLKTIEEPPAKTYLLFVAEFAQSLVPTIRSRCQLLRFATPPSGTALGWLHSQHPEANADTALLKQAGGAPLKVLEWLTSGHTASRLRWQTVLADVASRKIEALPAAFELSREKSEVGGLLRYWQSYMTEQLRALPNQWSQRHESFHALLIESLKRLENTNANPQLLLESLLLRWRLL